MQKLLEQELQYEEKDYKFDINEENDIKNFEMSDEYKKLYYAALIRGFRHPYLACYQYKVVFDLLLFFDYRKINEYDGIKRFIFSQCMYLTEYIYKLSGLLEMNHHIDHVIQRVLGITDEERKLQPFSSVVRNYIIYVICYVFYLARSFDVLTKETANKLSGMKAFLEVHSTIYSSDLSAKQLLRWFKELEHHQIHLFRYTKHYELDIDSRQSECVSKIYYSVYRIIHGEKRYVCNYYLVLREYNDWFYISDATMANSRWYSELNRNILVEKITGDAIVFNSDVELRDYANNYDIESFGNPKIIKEIFKLENIKENCKTFRFSDDWHNRAFVTWWVDYKESLFYLFMIFDSIVKLNKRIKGVSPSMIDANAMCYMLTKLGRFDII
jgi:hypothetical protein